MGTFRRLAQRRAEPEAYIPKSIIVPDKSLTNPLQACRPLAQLYIYRAIKPVGAEG